MTTYNRYTIQERIIGRGRTIKEEETGWLLFSIHLKLLGKNRGYRLSHASGIELIRSKDDGGYFRRDITTTESNSQFQTTIYISNNKIVMDGLGREFTIGDVKPMGRSFKLFRDGHMVMSVRGSLF